MSNMLSNHHNSRRERPEVILAAIHPVRNAGLSRQRQQQKDQSVLAPIVSCAFALLVMITIALAGKTVAFAALSTLF